MFGGHVAVHVVKVPFATMSVKEYSRHGEANPFTCVGGLLSRPRSLISGVGE
jgi:hypothetical protein